MFSRAYFDLQRMIRTISILIMAIGRSRTLPLVVFAGFVFSACSLWGPSKIPLNDQPIKAQAPNWSALVLQASADANSNTALEVDIVFAATPEVKSMVEGLGAGKWFTVRDSMLRNLSTQLHVISLELVPGQTMKLGRGDYSQLNAIGVLVFANYSNPGDHKTALPLTQNSQLVLLDAKGFRVLTVPANSKY
ncbi:MAG: hypothetical protein EBQ82_09850 [Betaproteobacteria bacterium]|nr:hypothetical protein [Betaproteobacteria bacterium]